MDHDLLATVRMRVELHLDQGRPDAALAELAPALASAPDDQGLLGQQAVALIQTGRHADALRVVDGMLATAPNDPDTHLLASIAHLALRNPGTAVTAAQWAAHLAPADPRAHRQLARALAASGRTGHAPARAAAERALELDPHDPASHLAMVDALHPEGSRPRRQDLALAEQHVRAALDLEPGDPTALNELARVQAARHRGAAAAGTLSRAVAGSPQEALYHRNMDVVLAGQVGIAHWVLFIAYFVLARATDGYERGWVAALAALSLAALGYLGYRLVREVRTARLAYVRGFARREPLMAVWAGLLLVSTAAFVLAALVPPAGTSLLVVAAIGLIAGAVLSWVAWFRARRSG